MVHTVSNNNRLAAITSRALKTIIIGNKWLMLHTKTSTYDTLNNKGRELTLSGNHEIANNWLIVGGQFYH